MNASIQKYLPVLAIMSTQASQAVVRRYMSSKMLVLTGVLSDDATASTFAFFRQVVGFELDAFFERNSKKMRTRCTTALNGLLDPS
jgi:hypothetical protein